MNEATYLSYDIITAKLLNKFAPDFFGIVMRQDIL